tara:strand:+ start:596 stop:1063 length:468 start_codon:yes stop_codon:yes gene_type:complete
LNTYEIIGGDNRAHGPVTGEEIYNWIRQGRADGYTMTRLSGSDTWQPLGSFPEFVGPLHGLPWVRTLKKSPKTDSLAIASLVLGIVSIIFQPLGLFFGVPAAYLGHRSLHAIGKQPEEIGGHGLAVGGLVTGYIGSVLGAISLVLLVMLVLAIRN